MVFPSTEPASTHPKWVSNAVGLPSCPNRRPVSKTSTNTSTPSSRSMRPGEPKSGSANWRPFKWSHSDLNGTECVGSSQVTWGTIAAVTPTTLVDKLTGETSKVVKQWVCDLCARPATPDMTTSRFVRWRLRLWARRSDMNEADEALSSRALATTKEPLEDFTRTRQVISKLCFMPTVVAEKILSCGRLLD